MQGADVLAVANIEAASPSAWNVQQVNSELQRDSGISLVAALAEGKILGWCCGFTAVQDGELLKIAVHPGYRLAGIGGQLLDSWCLLMLEQGAEQIFLELRSHNRAALQLYVGRGFQETGRRKEYYCDPVDDAVILVCPLRSVATAKE